MSLWIPATLLLSALGAQDVVGNIQQDGSTSAREKMRFASSAVSEMRKVNAELQALHEGAQVVDARLCLGSELEGLGELISVSEASTLAIPEALASGNHSAAEQEFRKISVALARARNIRQAGFACAVLPPSETTGWSGEQAADAAPVSDSGS
ncbi:MAG: hypothetical protein ACI9VR_000877 [Cognaticolwellia sp.]